MRGNCDHRNGGIEVYYYRTEDHPTEHQRRWKMRPARADTRDFSYRARTFNESNLALRSISSSRCKYPQIISILLLNQADRD